MKVNYKNLYIWYYLPTCSFKESFCCYIVYEMTPIIDNNEILLYIPKANRRYKFALFKYLEDYL